jgi:hypothetical protein
LGFGHQKEPQARQGDQYRKTPVRHVASSLSLSDPG